MAKDKKATTGGDTAVADRSPAEERVEELERALAAATQRATELENLFVGVSETRPISLLEDLDYCRKFFSAAGKPAGERFTHHYTLVRDTVGESAQAIDRKLRGVQ